MASYVGTSRQEDKDQIGQRGSIKRREGLKEGS